MTDATIDKTGAENVLWDLSVFYDGIDDPRIEQDMDKLREQADAFAERYRGKVGELAAAEVGEAIATVESLYELASRLRAFAFLLYSEDTNNPAYGALVQKLTEFGSEIDQKLLFFDLEWNAVDDDKAQAIIDDPAVGKYRHPLEAERRFKPYQLTEAEEQLLVEKDVTGNNAWVRYFTQLHGALRYEFDGEEHMQAVVLNKLFDADRNVRIRASDSVTNTLKTRMMELTYIFNVLLADKAANDRRRGFDRWVSARNLSNKVSDDVVDALIEAVTSSYDIVAQHYTLKRKLLGLDELMDYDRYAPLSLDGSERTYDWEGARDIVLNAFSTFSPQMSDIAGKFFSESWIHAPVMQGKRGGAFSAPTVPSAHPFVMVNFTGRPRDVMTLAHELGHGVHQYLASKQGMINANTPLTIAEMASVFGEMLVFTDLMEREPDAGVRLGMLVDKIEDTFATVFRQVAMNRFEDAMHTARRSEGELPTERFSKLWIDTQQAMFKGSVTLSDNYQIWWSYIPHFIHTPGYVYAYAFGELLVLALFNLYRERGEAFVPDYIDVLAAGGSDWPENILAKVGVDLTDAAFWNEGLDAIRDLVEQEETLAREVYPDLFE